MKKFDEPDAKKKGNDKQHLLASRTHRGNKRSNSLV